MFAATWGERRERLWECSMAGNELCQFGNAIKLFDRVNIGIDDPCAHRRTSRRADHGVRPLRPPFVDLRLVGGRVLETVRCKRLFVLRFTRKNREPLARVLESGVE